MRHQQHAADHDRGLGLQYPDSENDAVLVGGVLDSRPDPPHLLGLELVV